MSKPSGRALSIAASVSPSSSASVIWNGMISMPIVALALCATRSIIGAGRGSYRSAALFRAGLTSLSSSTHFSTSWSLAVMAKPVTLPPGLAKLWAKPRATGSLVTETIGILSAADLGARVTTAPGANNTASSSRTSSIASCAQALRMAVGIASLDHEVTALNKADTAKPLPYTIQCLSITTFRSDPEIANAYPIIRLGKRGAKRSAPRPRNRRTAEQRDELAPFHQQFLPCFEAEDSTAGNLLHCGISKEPLSAVGHFRQIGTLQTPRDVRFAPRADIDRRDGNVRFVLKADSCIATKNNLLDNLVGACEERRRYREAERLRRNQVYDEIELSRLLDRQLRWFRPAQDFIGIVAGAP